MVSVSRGTLESYIVGFAPTHPGRLLSVHERAIQVNHLVFEASLLKDSPFYSSPSTEMANSWANLFQCNASSTLLTCSHDVSAGTACLAEYALGTFESQSAKVTVARNGISHREDLPTNTTTSDSTRDTASPTLATLTAAQSSTCPSTVTYNKTQLVAIRAGLGAGLGLPLIIIGGVLIYCSKG